VAVLLDGSASMTDKLPIAQEAAIQFVRELHPRDVATIIEFDTHAQIWTEFTNDRAALENAIRQTWADGSTALYDAVYGALGEFDKLGRGDTVGEPRRRAVVVLSDGADTSSIVRFRDLLEATKRSGAVIYTIGIGIASHGGGRIGPVEADLALRRLAQQTGGRAFFPEGVKGLPSVYREITSELSSQYVLGYASTNPRRDGRWRRITVRLRRQGLFARTRPGYYEPAR
jgi:Ca-activated chloride channel family protein